MVLGVVPGCTYRVLPSITNIKIFGLKSRDFRGPFSGLAPGITGVFDALGPCSPANRRPGRPGALQSQRIRPGATPGPLPSYLGSRGQLSRLGAGGAGFGFADGDVNLR